MSSLQNNPLKQYFRRPAVYLTLPSNGKFYAEGVIKQRETAELPVFPMTAIDEITIRTPDALFNGDAMAQLIKSCVPDIAKPWEINSIDLDAILIAIRSASGENNMDMDSTCPKCNEVNSYTIELHKVLPQLKCPDFDQTLQINNLQVKFRPLTYKELNQVSLDQFTVQRTFAGLESITDEDERRKQTQNAVRLVTDITMKLVSTAIQYIDTGDTRVEDKSFILDFLVNCDKDTYIQVRDFTTKLRESTQIKPMHISCPNCQHEYDQPFTLNMSDFFG
jgi:hypothetical protein